MRCRPALVAAAAALLATLVGGALGAADRIGQVSWLEGEALLVRSGAELPAGSLEIGSGIENFDSLQTGADGAVEVCLGPAGSSGGIVRMAPQTQFSFEIAKLAGRQQTSVSLIAGTVGLKVAKLTAGQDLKVRTQSTTMSGDIRPGLSAGEFFQRFRAERSDLQRKIATVRYVAKLFALRSGGRVPLGSFDDLGDEASFLGD
jgi:hypothetical protein